MSDAKSATLQPPVLCGTRWAMGVGVASRLLQHEIRLGLIETALFKHLFMRLASLIGLRRRRRRRQWTRSRRTRTMMMTIRMVIERAIN